MVGSVITLDYSQLARPFGGTSECPADGRFDHQQVVGDLIDEVSIMAHKQHGSLELFERPLQGIACPKVEVVGGLVEHEEVGFGCG